MSDKATVIVRGTLDWAKILGNPRPHTGQPKYDKGPYWSVDFTPTPESRKILEAQGLSKKFRDPSDNPKEHRTESFLSLRVLAKNAQGEDNRPPSIVDARNQPWGEALIGNGSVADVKLKIVDYGKAAEKGVYLQAVRVLKLVPYEGGGFAPLDADDEYAEDAAAAAEDNWE